MITTDLPRPWIKSPEEAHWDLIVKRSGEPLSPESGRAYITPTALQRLAALGSDYNGWFNGATIQVRLARYVVHDYQAFLEAVAVREGKARAEEAELRVTMHTELVDYLRRAHTWTMGGRTDGDSRTFYQVSNLLDRWHNCHPVGYRTPRSDEELDAALIEAGYGLYGPFVTRG